jgi:uncharacterized membrane protein
MTTPFVAVGPPVITEDTVRQLAQRLMDMEARLGTQEVSLNASRADNQRLSDAAQQARLDANAARDAAVRAATPPPPQRPEPGGPSGQEGQFMVDTLVSWANRRPSMARWRSGGTGQS